MVVRPYDRKDGDNFFKEKCDGDLVSLKKKTDGFVWTESLKL